VTPGQHAEYKRAQRVVSAGWKAGVFGDDPLKAKVALKSLTAHIGTPIPGEYVAKTVREHGHLGLRAFDVAATWTLSRRCARPRLQGRGGTRRVRRILRRARARSPGRKPADDPEPEPLAACAAHPRAHRSRRRRQRSWRR
jgi:hypothetical protein